MDITTKQTPEFVTRCEGKAYRVVVATEINKILIVNEANQGVAFPLDDAELVADMITSAIHDHRNR